MREVLVRPASDCSVISIPTDKHDSKKRFEQSMSSISSVFASYDSELMADINRKPTQDWRFLTAVLTPIFAITILSVVCITDALEQYSESAHLSTEVEYNRQLSYLITSLQKERGMSCAFLSKGGDLSSSENMALMNTLLEFRQVSDENSNVLTDETLISIQLYRDVTSTIRSLVNARQIDCDGTLAQYSPVISKLIYEMVALYTKTTEGTLWGTIEAYNGMLIIKNNYGILRAVGSTYFSTGQLDSNNHAYFVELQGVVNRFLSKAFMESDITQKVYQEVTLGNSLTDKITKMIGEISKNDPVSGSTDSALTYFNNISSFIVLISEVEDAVSDEVLTQLGIKISHSELYIALSSMTAILVLSICPPLTYWYAVRMKDMMMNLKTFMSHRTNELKLEQQRTDQLLFQMMPKQIAIALRQKEKVLPEIFQSTTVFFSEVVGFTALVAKSTPYEMCNFLNQLYSTFDAVLDNYDVYKVETIGDSYMVVSGLPRRNRSHAAEIATMALNILGSLRTFLIEHIDYEQVLVQIGIHTGPCAAGIVGTKMPRYCLFGDTVNTTARMMTSGAPNKIQVTEDTKVILDEDGFQTVERGQIVVKGKATINTFWLLSRENFQYRVDLAEAERVYNRSTYWKAQSKQSTHVRYGDGLTYADLESVPIN